MFNFIHVGRIVNMRNKRTSISSSDVGILDWHGFYVLVGRQVRQWWKGTLSSFLILGMFNSRGQAMPKVSRHVAKDHHDKAISNAKHSSSEFDLGSATKTGISSASGGAVIGSLAGGVGTVVGAVTGAVVGLVLGGVHPHKH